MLLTGKDFQQVSNEVMNMLHEEEVEIVNQFHDAVLAQDLNKIEELFKVLLYDVEDHFSTEEQMMEESQFYAMQMHKNEHDTMRQKLTTLYKNWQIHHDTYDLQEFLEKEFKQWLNLHIARWDAETAMHLGDTM